MSEVSEFLKYLYGPDVHGSHERPGAFLKWSRELSDDQGEMFWEAITDCWRLFDNIPYSEFSEEFDRFRSTAPGHDRDITIYRGQDVSYELGLSWTTDEKVAETFARGLRGRANPTPVICRLEAFKEEIAFSCDERAEAEIVLFKAPEDDEVDFKYL